ncbi:unnamed protein product [Acanthoscelides obtectus]|uniref:Uncharacterized protein n=1 Tax=Acanthoscelides obtectus TaxID=200917 RepID=A0A9P0JLL7_ACAOB|nr:unnamed protein product [Acanthoscelides obtectus]CAK1628864.1 hypothetical protein AOBTE_LOCUS5438 [Acanthoscelides obtectus]
MRQSENCITTSSHQMVYLNFLLISQLCTCSLFPQKKLFEEVKVFNINIICYKGYIAGQLVKIFPKKSIPVSVLIFYAIFWRYIESLFSYCYNVYNKFFLTGLPLKISRFLEAFLSLL